MPGPTQAPQPTIEDFAAFEQLRQEVSPSEFNETMLSTAAEADPMAVAEFKSELRGLELPPEVLDVLNNMVDEILASPERYAEIRAHYKTQDMPDDMLPETFDAEFFGALNMAIDEIRATSGAPQTAPQGFAKGGVASLRPIAEAMAKQGRYGDTMLAHISPREAGVLKRMGGSGTVNPQTGLPEFFLKKVFKGIGKVFKKIGRAVKKFANTTIGKIVISTALFFIAGPAAAAAMGVQSAAGVAAVSGFVAGAGSSLAAGNSLKDSLKAGAIGGIAAGAFTGITQGADAFKAPTPAPVTELGEALTVTDVTAGSTDLLGTAASPGNALGTSPPITRAPIDGLSLTAPQPQAGFSVGDITSTVPNTSAVPSTSLMQPLPPALRPPQQAGFSAGGVESLVDTSGAVSSGGGQLAGPLSDGGGSPFISRTPVDETVTKSLTERITDLPRRAWDKVSPSAIENRALAASGEAYQPAYDAVFSATQDAAAAQAAGLKAMEAAASPSMLAKYGPLAGVGLGVMGLSGGFSADQPEVPPGFGDMAAGMSPGQQLLDKYPDKYGLRFGGVETISQSNPYLKSNPYLTYSPYTAAKGSGPAGVAPQNFPRRNGPISGPGTGTSDDVPAMLSDGEFVFTAKSVRNMGNGSRRKGAKKMYALMKKLEGASNG